MSADRTPIRGTWGYRGAAPSELLDKPSDGFTWLPAESLDEALERDLVGLVRFWDVSDDDVDRAQAAVAAGLAELQTILAHENTPSVIWVGLGGRLGCSALAGFARSVRMEHPELRLQWIGLDSNVDASALREAMACSHESEVWIRDGNLVAPRLVRAPKPELLRQRTQTVPFCDRWLRRFGSESCSASGGGARGQRLV